ncbi:MAG: type II toxin-antitoxin system PemK/MazF family toxin [Gammaproteobacteria bacterium]|nr:type II toxin-antitoxin system PemK/MazF family toxin [Gammaproteobacteria bacterium]
MIKHKSIQRGDVYWINPNPVAGREMKDRHRFAVITPKQINDLGIAMTVPITSGGQFARKTGLTVPILGHDTTGVAVCNQVLSFDLSAREKEGSACYIETLDESTVDDIISRVLSIIDPA